MTANEAHVKAIAVSGEEFSRVASVKQARRVGPNHQDTTDRSVTGTTSPTVLETVTIPADTLGTRGGVKLDLIFDFDGTNSTKSVAVRARLDELGGPGACQVCSLTDQWTISAHLARIPIEGLAFGVGRQQWGFPCVSIACGNCGNMVFMSAIMLGLQEPRDPPEESDV